MLWDTEETDEVVNVLGYWLEGCEIESHVQQAATTWPLRKALNCIK